MRRETRHRLDATGVILFDAATCRLEPDSRLEDFRAMVEAAAYLGARRVDVNGNDPDRARLTDQFAALCALCAEHGLGVGIEFMMSTQVKTLGDALALFARSVAGNAAVTVDALHLARSGGSPADVAALDPAQIAYVQLCDGLAEPPEGGYAREAAAGRLLPGDGDLPVRALIDAVGPDVMLGVEGPVAAARRTGCPGHRLRRAGDGSGPAAARPAPRRCRLSGDDGRAGRKPAFVRSLDRTEVRLFRRQPGRPDRVCLGGRLDLVADFGDRTLRLPVTGNGNAA